MASVLTKATRRAFQGKPGFLTFLPSVQYGPFYRVDKGAFSTESQSLPLASHWPLTNLNPDKAYLRQFRSHELETLVQAAPTTERDLAIAFIRHNTVAIEMDPSFKLLAPFITLFSSPRLRRDVKEKWKALSPGRWCGLIQPQTLAEAHKLYFLKHLIRPVGQSFYLFKFDFFGSPDLSAAGLFFGKTRNGSATQFKYNNPAIDCITGLQCLGPIA